jgi:hypothetical protein
MQTKSVSFDLDRLRINRITCWDQSQPKPGEDCKVATSEQITCGAGESYVVELLDLAQKRI